MALANLHCLHTPSLYTQANALLFWEQLPAAEGYELECSLDAPFSRAAHGLKWDYLDDLDNSWDQLQTEIESWDQFEGFPAKGTSWQAVRFGQKNWAALAAAGRTWAAIAALPSKFTVYRGPAQIVPGYDRGQKWDDLDLTDRTWDAIDTTALWDDWNVFECLADGGLTWGQMTGKGLSWAEIEALPDPLDPGETGYAWRSIQFLPVRGLNWEVLEAKRYDWQAIEGAIDTWGGFDGLPAHTNAHVGAVIFVPDGNWHACYRVRAYDAAGGYSDYYETQQIALIHQAQLEVALQDKARYDLQVETSKARNLIDGLFILTYDPRVLTIEAFSLYASDGSGSLTQAQPEVVTKGEGFILFRCLAEIAPATVLDGLIVRLGAQAKFTGTTRILLDSFSETERLF